MSVSYKQITTPIGRLRICATDEAIVGVRWDDSNQEDCILDLSGQLVLKCEQEIQEYFSGNRQSFDLPVSFSGTLFQKKVWEQMSKIPYGQTRSYQDIASLIGHPKACRAVGSACHKNLIMLLIPCHRVIASGGRLGGYGGGLDAKIYLLEMEKGRV